MRKSTFLRPTILAALALSSIAAAIFGPPRITVTEVNGTPPTAGAVLEIKAEHHTDEPNAQVTGRAITMRGTDQVSKDLTITPSATKGRFGVAKQWDAGTAYVLVFTVVQGDHGEHGKAESLVKVEKSGRILEIVTPGGENARGDRFPRALTPKEIEEALNSLRGGQK